MTIRNKHTKAEIEERNKRQESVFAWAQETFGGADSSPRIRMIRLVEETIELAQAQGLSIEDVLREVDIVYRRPVGYMPQEIGGVTVTLMAFAQSVGQSVAACEHAEIARVNAKPNAHFKARQEEKHAQGRV